MRINADRADIIEKCRKSNTLIYVSLSSYESPIISVDVDNGDDNYNSVKFPIEVQCRCTSTPIYFDREVNS
jgi:hypothetical protein